jgi:hypothetical protein
VNAGVPFVAAIEADHNLRETYHDMLRPRPAPVCHSQRRGLMADDTSRLTMTGPEGPGNGAPGVAPPAAFD